MIPQSPTVVLASASPRRRELLAFLGLSFNALGNDGEERRDPPPDAVLAALPPAPLPRLAHPTLLAWRKAHAACIDAPDSVIIGADTIVVLGEDILGKPLDAADARAMLRRLSGKTHVVYTGLAVLQPAANDKRERQALAFDLQLDLVSSQVAIAELTDTQIAAYVATGEPLDKAGAYGIQGLGGRLVREVTGSYTCVVGLPLVELHRMLDTAHVADLVDPTDAYRRWLAVQGKEPLPCPPTFP